MLKIEQVGGNKRPDLDRPFGKVCFQCVSALFGDLVIYFIFRGGYCHACLPAPLIVGIGIGCYFVFINFLAWICSITSAGGAGL